MTNMQENLRELASRQTAAVPWSFEEFEQRQARAAHARRDLVWGGALSMAALALVAGLALLTQPPLRSAEHATAPAVEHAAVTRAEALPALVDMNQFDVTSELEDRIALLDAEISAARVHQLPAEQLRPIEITREQLNDSLQSVSYAHALLRL